MAPRLSWLAASATPRLSARHALKNRSPASAARSSAPTRRAGSPPTPASCRGPETPSPPFAELAAPPVQHIRIDLAGSCHLTRRRPHLQPPHRGQFELFC